MNAFEDIKREYVNRYSETGGVILAQDYESFVHKMLSALQTALNDSGICDDLLGESFKRNPDMTPDEWSQIKQQFMVFMFHQALTECPQLKHEMAVHLYNELRKENTHD